MRAYPFILILATILTAACGGDDAAEGGAVEAVPTSETSPVVVDSSTVAVPGDVDSMVAPEMPPPSYSPPMAAPEPRVPPPELGKDSIPAGSGRGKGRPPRRSDSPEDDSTESL